MEEVAGAGDEVTPVRRRDGGRWRQGRRDRAMGGEVGGARRPGMAGGGAGPSGGRTGGRRRRGLRVKAQGARARAGPTWASRAGAVGGGAGPRGSPGVVAVVCPAAGGRVRPRGEERG